MNKKRTYRTLLNEEKDIVVLSEAQKQYILAKLLPDFTKDGKVNWRGISTELRKIGFEITNENLRNQMKQLILKSNGISSPEDSPTAFPLGRKVKRNREIIPTSPSSPSSSFNTSFSPSPSLITTSSASSLFHFRIGPVLSPTELQDHIAQTINGLYDSKDLDFITKYKLNSLAFQACNSNDFAEFGVNDRVLLLTLLGLRDIYRKKDFETSVIKVVPPPPPLITVPIEENQN